MNEQMHSAVQGNAMCIYIFGYIYAHTHSFIKCVFRLTLRDV